MQCKDIPDLPIIKFLDNLGLTLANWFGNEYSNSVTLAMPENTPSKLVLAKMRQLIKKGLVDGCVCGCRGDFEITEKGKEYLNKWECDEDGKH